MDKPVPAILAGRGFLAELLARFTTGVVAEEILPDNALPGRDVFKLPPNGVESIEREPNRW